MWAYTDDEVRWLNFPAAESMGDADGGNSPTASHEIVQDDIAEGRPSAAPGAEVEPEVDAAHRLITPLTSIKSSSEILQDNPDMPLDQRARFLDIIAQESERLTQAIHEVLGRTGPAAHLTRPGRSAGS